MKKISSLLALLFLAGGCSVLSELTAIQKCDLSFREGQEITLSLLKESLPFEVIANVEVNNPGSTMAAVSGPLSSRDTLHSQKSSNQGIN